MVEPDDAASHLSPWIEALGYEVASEGEVRLVWGDPGPTVVPADGRSDTSTVHLPKQAHLLDLATALRSALFQTHAAYRRYARQEGRGADVRFQTEEGEHRGRLMCVCRRGAFVRTEERLQPPKRLELELVLPSGAHILKVRPMFEDGVGTEPGFAVEFALDAPDVAPPLAALAAQERSAVARPSSRAG